MTVLSPGNCLDDIYVLHKYCYWGLDNELALVEIVDSDGVHRVYNQDNNAQ